jgi:hypothetical protein
MNMRIHHNSTNMLVGTASPLVVRLGHSYNWLKRCDYCGITETRKRVTGYPHAVGSLKERQLL